MCFLTICILVTMYVYLDSSYYEINMYSESLKIIVHMNIFKYMANGPDTLGYCVRPLGNGIPTFLLSLPTNFVQPMSM